MADYGIEPKERFNIAEAAGLIANLISEKAGVPPIEDMAEIWESPENEETGQTLTMEQHVKVLARLFMSTVVMLAERMAYEKQEHMEINMLVDHPTSGQDVVHMRLSGYSDLRSVVAALGKLGPAGYLQQLWNVATLGVPDPDGPEVLVRKIKTPKEESEV